MAKAKTRRAKGRTATSPKRARGPAKSRKSNKSLKARAKTAARARRRPARKSVTRRAAMRRHVTRRSPVSARAKGKRPQRVARPVKKAARPVKKIAKPVKKAARAVKKPAKAVKARALARKPLTKRPVARKVVAVPIPTPTAAPVARPAPAAPRVTAAPARTTRRSRAPVHGKLPALDRERRRLPEAEVVQSPPSSLDLNRTPSAARSGQAEIAHHLADHNETGPEITGGDVDASWESAYSTGDEAPGGDNPTPDQDVVDEIGRSLGLVYEDSEELKGADKITERDKHRWELDPASAEDFEDR